MLFKKLPDNHKNWDSRIDILKWIAIITMTIDHVGYLFFPGDDIFRIIGRITFPIFGYLIANSLVHTSNRKVFIRRLGFFAIISQIPYYLAFHLPVLNVLFTFFIAALMIQLFEIKKSWWWRSLFILIFLVFYTFFVTDYNYLGCLLVISFYCFRDKKILSILFFILINFVISITLLEIQIYALLALPLIYIPFKIRFLPFLKVNKYFFYLFYPCHVLILHIIDLFI